MNRAYKYRIYPNEEQKALMEKTFGCVRFIYNKMLQDRIAIYEKYKNDKELLQKQKYPLPASYKEKYPWLKEVDSLALANAQMNLQSAYRNFFKNNHFKFPKFKSKHNNKNSYTTNNQKDTIRLVDEKTVRLPKLKNIKIKLHRPIPEKACIKAATVSKTATGKYYIAILLELPDNPVCEKAPMQQEPASRFAKPDYSSYYHDEALELKIKKAQKKLGHRKTGSQNYEKQKQKLAKLFEKKANKRKDFLHKLSRQIANACKEEKEGTSLWENIHIAECTDDTDTFKMFLQYKMSEQGIA